MSKMNNTPVAETADSQVKKISFSGLLLATAYGESVPDRFSIIHKNENGQEVTTDITNAFYKLGGYSLDEVEAMQKAEGGQAILGRVKVTFEVSEV